ncbi:MAG: hypothetical protein Q8O88_03740 [bacterium]|nr:hypothetical protein [bacterium]
MRNFTIDGKVIFQDKSSPELRSLIEAVHKEEERQDWEFANSPHGSVENMTDAEFARHLRVMVRLREQAKQQKKS